MTRTPNPPQNQTACQYNRDCIDAICWSNSDDPVQREFATSALSDIATPEALEYERAPSRDSDRDVANSAKEELKDWAEAQQPRSFERQTPVP
jgi:hypothetical protein